MRPGRQQVSMRQLNLTFHGLGEIPTGTSADEAAVWLDIDAFEAVLDRIAGRSDVGVTFDDGNRSDYEVALPALLGRGLTATFFVVTFRIGERQYLGGDEVRELAREGMRIGSHGLAHRDWRELSDVELTEELSGSRRELEMLLQTPVSDVSCPFGSYDRRVLAGARAAGYERVFTSDGGWVSSGAWLQARNTLGAGDAPSTADLLLRGPTLRARVRDPLRRTVKRLR